MDAIDRITPDGITLKTGEEVSLDVIILATGFDLSEKGLGINVVGREGRTVTEQWEEQKGPQAYLGTTIAGFPNLYTILGPNVIVGHSSVVYSTESQVLSPLLFRFRTIASPYLRIVADASSLQVNLIVQMIEPMVKYGVKSFEVKIDAETKYNRNLVKRLSKTVWDGGCKSYYKVNFSFDCHVSQRADALPRSARRQDYRNVFVNSRCRLFSPRSTTDELIRQIRGC